MSAREVISKDDDRELPEGWTGASVLSLGELIRGVSYAKGEAATSPVSGRVALLRANNIADGLVFEELQYVPGHRVSSEQRLRVGDVVVAMSSGSKLVVGKAASLREPWDGTFGAFCGVLRPNREVDPGYFGLLFQTKEYRRAISEASAGTNINNLKREYFADLTMPVPPLAEQKRIVAKVEQLLARVNAARQRLAKAPAILKRFRQSVLAAACSGQLTAEWREEHEEASPQPTGPAGAPDDLPATWAQTTVGEVIEGLKYGTSKKCDYAHNGVPVLRIPNIGDGVITQDDMKYADLEVGEIEQLRLRSGDLLMIRSNGSVSLLGKTALVGKAETDFAYAGYLIRLRPDPAKVLPAFLNAALSSFGVRLQIELPARSTSGVNNINSDEVRALSIPLPPVPEQREIIRQFQGFSALADKIEARIQAGTARVEKITQAILARAFRGELVPTEAELARQEGRGYEPAAVLLERIHSRRDSTILAARPRRSAKAKEARHGRQQ